MYAQILQPNGVVHLKTDSEFLHGYTLGVVQVLEYPILYANHHIYHPDNLEVPTEATAIETHYERLFRTEGKPITYLKFGMNG